MVRSLAALEKEIRELDPSSQKELLRILVEQLDVPLEADVEQAWIEEIQRRTMEIDSGAVKCVPADEVFSNLDEHLKR